MKDMEVVANGITTTEAKLLGASTSPECHIIQAAMISVDETGKIDPNKLKSNAILAAYAITGDIVI